jgi:ElaB/YqjD/DUF883 family membrane-anchored ribosome-binding protein
MTEMTHAHREKLMSDLKVVVADMEELLKLAAGQVGDKGAELRQRIQRRMEQAKGDLALLQDAAVGRAKDAGRVADTYVHDSPWTAVGIAAGAGLLIGLLIGRR